MKKTDNILWNIIDSLRNDIPSYEFANYMIQLVFLKQICSSDFFPNDKEIDYRLIMSVQQIFAGFDSYFNEDELFKTYNMIEKAYNIQFGSLSLSAKKLGRLFSDQTTYKRIIETLRLFSFPTDKSTMIDLINSILDEASYREGKYGGNNITTRPINDIFSGILNAKSGGRLLIPYCGYSRLALNNDFDEIICLSNDEDAIMISNMIMLLTGKRSFKIGRLDASEMQERSNFDKIAVDGPLTGAIYPKNISSNSNSIRYEIFNITYPLEHLNIGGIAVITSVIAPLNTQTAQYKELRKRLISGDLKAVINLPPLWLKTGVNTNIIVLEKGYTGDVLFIDYQDKIQSKGIDLSSDEIVKIIDFINNPRDEEGFSKIVPRDNLMKDDEYSLRANKYVEKKNDKIIFRPVSEIEDELKFYYKVLKELI